MSLQKEQRNQERSKRQSGIETQSEAMFLIAFLPSGIETHPEKPQHKTLKIK